MRDRAVINRLGFNNQGHAAALERLRSRPRGLVGVNVGAGRDADDRIADYVSGVERFAAVADYLTVNISSPNTPGLRDLQAPHALDALLMRVEAARKALPGRSPPLLLKLAPDLDDQDLPEIVRIALAHGVDGLIVSNTTLARDGLNEASFAAETGGLSGRPLFLRSTRMLARVYTLTGGKLPLIGVGGINSGATALDQDRGRRLALAALYRTRLRGTVAHRPHQAGAGAGDRAGLRHDVSPHSSVAVPMRGPRGRWREARLSFAVARIGVDEVAASPAPHQPDQARE